MFSFDQHPAVTDETLEWSAAYCLATLSNGERERFERHLASCSCCRNLVKRDAELLGNWALPAAAEMPAGAQRRFLRRIQSSEEAAENEGILLSRHGLLIVRSTAMEWQPAAAPGIWMKPLFVDPERQYATSLIRIDKGIHYPAHRHVDVEEVYLLEGDLLIEGNALRSGDYCRAEPNSIHHESSTAEGCLFVLVSSQRDEVLR